MKKRLFALGLLIFSISCSYNPGKWRVRHIESTSEGACQYYWAIADANDATEYSKIDSCNKWRVGDTLIFKTNQEIENEKFLKGWKEYGWNQTPADSLNWFTIDSVWYERAVSY